jgi:hypothetical protein
MIIKSLYLIILFSLPLLGQTNSPYTILGVGDIEYSNSARRIGMGGLGVSIADENFINTLNPAGWNRINRTRIEFAVGYDGTFLSDDNGSGYYGEMEFAGFTMAFPVSSLYGITASVGLVPVTNVSFEIVEPFESPQPYEIISTGSGGLSKLFIGTSYQLPFGLAAGAAADYYFGNLTYTYRNNIIGSASKYAEYENRYNPKGLGGTLGLISPDIASLIDSNSVSELWVGASVSYFGSLDLDTILVSRSSNSVDTVYEGSGTMQVPLKLNFGAHIILTKRYLLSLDYSLQPWSEFKVNDVVQPNLRNAQKFSLGFEYRPVSELGTTFWEQIIWRSGLSFEETQYIINNEGINEFSVSGGFSLPISSGNTIDIGLQFSMRGTKDSNLIKENTIRLNAGISLGELWFIRQSF